MTGEARWSKAEGPAASSSSSPDTGMLGHGDVTVPRPVVSGDVSPDVTNATIGRLLREMAQVMAMENASAHRIRAYRVAAEVAEESIDSIAALARESPERLLQLRGVGPGVARRIDEIVRTGRLRELDEPARREKLNSAQFMRVPGIGHTRALMLARSLGVGSLSELADAARAGRIRGLPGFGAATEARIARDAESMVHARPRLLRPAAHRYGDAVMRAITRVTGVKRAALAGELRRACETLDDLSVVVSCTRDCEVLSHLTSLPFVGEVLSHNATEASVLLHTGLRATAYLVPDDAFGLHLLFRTGGGAHIRQIRELAATLGITFVFDGVLRGSERLAGREEAEVYAALGLPWIPPELREGRGEVAAGLASTLPRLITLGAVRGDLQSHTTDSDGRHSLERMATGAESLGYEYLAITDHSPALRVVRGLDRDDYRRQWDQIDALNDRLRGVTLLKGAEVDIAEDGSLDLDDETLAGFDIVLVSMHSKFGLPAAAQTRRLLRAVSHGQVDILAHPTGRILGRRAPAEFDADAVFRAAADHGVMLEVNGQPDRLDLDDSLCRAALERGCRIALGTDAHSVHDLDYMRWGVDQARRGWAAEDQVVNTRSLEELRPLLHRNR